MTSKEALEIIRAYHNQISLLCKGKLNNKIINAENQIEKDLDRLEEINNVWHKNEVMESVDINGNHLQEVYDFINSLLEENTKLKKVIDILKEVLKRVLIFKFGENIDNNGYISITKIDCNNTTIVNIRKEEYDLLKEVLENE